MYISTIHMIFINKSCAQNSKQVVVFVVAVVVVIDGGRDGSSWTQNERIKQRKQQKIIF